MAPEADENWNGRIRNWAAGRPDLAALIQIGSRAQEGATIDRWSDYDYQLITSRPGVYADGAFASELGDPLAVRATRGIITDASKVTVVLAGGVEADFVVLRELRVRLAVLLLRWPGAERHWPARIRRDLRDLRVVAGRGWRVVKGGPAWERRCRRISRQEIVLGEREFASVCADFWVQAVWTAKKIARGERLAAHRSIHRSLSEGLYRLLQEEAALEGRPARPDCRYAERWLSPDRRERVEFPSGHSRPALEGTLRDCAALFAEAAASVARLKGWPAPDYGPVRAWLAEALASGSSS